jgi:NADPH:quinone reductase-like Zn-dependent oxidoreductase
LQKVVIHSPGGYDKLKFEECSEPKAKDNLVLVKTDAIGVNYADCTVRWGIYESAKKYVGWPITPGFEFSGTVVEVGDRVRGVKPGAIVMGITRFDAYATHVLVPESQIFPLPSGFSPVEAAGFPAVYMTAYHALFQNIVIRPGMNLLVHSAAGGVGTALLQLGRAMGCKMVGVVGAAHKTDVALKFGASHVIDKSSEDLWKAAERICPEGYDVILDANGVETLRAGYKHLKPTGKLITYGFHTMLPKSSEKGKGRMNFIKLATDFVRTPKFSPIDLCTHNKGVIGFNVSFLFERMDLIAEAMEGLLKLVSEGKIKAPAVKTFPFHQVSEAHRLIESGRSVGKLVLVH